MHKIIINPLEYLIIYFDPHRTTVSGNRVKAVSIGVIKAAVSQAKMKRGAKAAIIAVSMAAGKMIKGHCPVVSKLSSLFIWRIITSKM